MAAMNPVLRLRRAFRSAGFEQELAEEAAETIDDGYPSRRETQQLLERLNAENRQYVAEMQARLVVIIIGIAALSLTVAGLLLAYVD